MRLADGTYRADRHGDLDSKPKAKGEPTRPKFSDPVARKFWDEYVPQLVEMGVAKATDAARLQNLCELWALVRKATKAANDDPLDKNARIAYVDYTKHFANAASEFGLNPSARSRIMIDKPSKPAIQGRQRG